MFKIAPWYHNYQTPVVLMIDDLSDTYIDKYKESYKNDWGYMCDQEGSAYHFLEQHLLSFYPNIKITFFVPYSEHGIPNRNCGYKIYKYAFGERDIYTHFLQKLVSRGYEISHHGSDHGHYINPTSCSVGTNWVHEWAGFKNVDEGVSITLKGVDLFQKLANIKVSGGKYCGHIAIANSAEIISQCNFLYWCDRSPYASYDISYFEKNNILSFPITFSGNSFIRLSYITGDPKRDRKKKFLKYFQPFYNILSYYKLYQLYKKGKVISIQEHISPSTTWGTIQSSNIVTDITSLTKIFKFLSPLNIWYATCAEIAMYQYIKDHSELHINEKELTISFNNSKNIESAAISVTHHLKYNLISDGMEYYSSYNNGLYTVSVPIFHGINTFYFSFQGK
jgi:hypothetical protein